MTELEYDLMPFSFIKKYGTYLTSIRDMQREHANDESKEFHGRWNDVREIDSLLTNAQKQELLTEKGENLEQGRNDPMPYEQVGYMSRQPRNNMRNKNYNFEQFREFTAMYETARVKDEKDSENFYRLVKYVIAKTEDGKATDKSNMIVRDFLRKYDLNLIDIPEEF